MSAIERRRALKLTAAIFAASLIPDHNLWTIGLSPKVDRRLTINVGNQTVQYLTSNIGRRGQVMVVGEQSVSKNALFRTDQNGEAYGPLISARFMTTRPDLVSYALERASMPDRIHPMSEMNASAPGTKSFDSRVTVFNLELDGRVEADTYLLDQSPIVSHRFVREIETGATFIEMNDAFLIRNGVARPLYKFHRVKLQTNKSGPIAVLAEDGNITLPFLNTSPRTKP